MGLHTSKHHAGRAAALDHLPRRRELAGAVVDAERDDRVTVLVGGVEELAVGRQCEEAGLFALSWLPPDG